jgi:hypothetical protein
MSGKENDVIDLAAVDGGLSKMPSGTAQGTAQIVPFGKYKGQPVEILRSDPGYTEWLMGQDWVRDRFPQLVQVIVNNFGEPAETPEHNKLQTLFLGDDFCRAVLRVCHPDHDPSVVKSVDCRFEVGGWDVLLTIIFTPYRGYPQEASMYDTNGYIKSWEERVLIKEKYEQEKAEFEQEVAAWRLRRASMTEHLHVEIKPRLGDDFPAVLRQMKANSIICGPGGVISKIMNTKILLIHEFGATGATLDQVRAMFKADTFMVVTLVEIADEMNRA